MARDVVEAVISLLKADGAVAALVAARVYGAELPPSQAAAGQRPSKQVKTIVLRRSPGSPGLGGYLELESANLDVFCYGETEYEANQVRLAVHRALKQARRQVWNQTLLHSFDLVGGASIPRDSETQWPYAVETWRFLASEVAAT